MIRIGIIGYGRMGKIHARAVREISSACLTAIADPSAPAETNCPFFPDAGSMLRLSTPDAVILSSPTATHRSIAESCIRARIPLLIEKPVTASFRDAGFLLELAQQFSVPVYVSFPERFNPLIVFLKRKLSNKPLTEIRFYRKSFFSRNIQEDGILYDLAIHDLDLVQFTTGTRISKIQLTAYEKDHQATLVGYLQSGCSFLIHAATGQEKVRRIEAFSHSTRYQGDLLNRCLTMMPDLNSSAEQNIPLPDSSADPARCQIHEWINILNGTDSSQMASLEETVKLLHHIEHAVKTTVDFIPPNAYHRSKHQTDR